MKRKLLFTNQFARLFAGRLFGVVLICLLAAGSLAAQERASHEGYGNDAVSAALRVFYRDGDGGRAVEILEDGRRYAEESPDGGYRMLVLAGIALANGEIHEVLGNRSGAEEHFSRALELAGEAASQNGGSSDALRMLADAGMRILPYRGMLYKAKHGFEPKEHAGKALEIDPDNREAVLSLGLYYLHCPKLFGGSPRKAETLFRQYSVSAADDLSRFRGRMWLAKSLAARGSTEKAKEALDAAADIFPNSPWLAVERRTVERP